MCIQAFAKIHIKDYVTKIFGDVRLNKINRSELIFWGVAKR